MNNEVKIPEVFPFTIRNCKSLFRPWLSKNIDWIKEQYGYTTFVGRDVRGADAHGYERSWSYYEVDGTVTSDTTVEFQTYGMECNVYGGRGRAEEKFTATFEAAELAELIEGRRQYVAELVYLRRLKAEEERQRQLAIDAVYAELFEKN